MYVDGSSSAGSLKLASEASDGGIEWRAKKLKQLNRSLYCNLLLVIIWKRNSLIVKSLFEKYWSLLKGDLECTTVREELKRHHPDFFSKRFPGFA